MDEKRLVILRAETTAQIKAIEDIYSKLEERKADRSKFALESVGYQLHNLYCAFEDLFKIIASTFENHIYDKSQYHIELLKRMTVTIEGVRPALVGNKCYLALDNLRSFRHFFRHAYSYEMDRRKIEIVLEDVDKLKDLYQMDIDLFLESFEN